MLDRGADDAGGRLGTQRQALAVQLVLERVHLPFDDVGRIADAAHEERRRLDDRDADVAVAVLREHFARGVLEALPQRPRRAGSTSFIPRTAFNVVAMAASERRARSGRFVAAPFDSRRVGGPADASARRGRAGGAGTPAAGVAAEGRSPRAGRRSRRRIRQRRFGPCRARALLGGSIGGRRSLSFAGRMRTGCARRERAHSYTAAAATTAASVKGIAQRVQPLSTCSAVGSSPIVGAVGCSVGASSAGVAAPAGNAPRTCSGSSLTSRA